MSSNWKALICLFCFCCFQISAQVDLDFFSRLYLSNKKYAKNIEVQTYLVTKEQVAQIFGRKKDELVQKLNKDLYNRYDEIYLLVRSKNKGDFLAFGTLKCNVQYLNHSITIDVIDLPGHMQSFHDCVIYVSGGFIPDNDQVLSISYEWEDLYTM